MTGVKMQFIRPSEDLAWECRFAVPTSCIRRIATVQIQRI